MVYVFGDDALSGSNQFLLLIGGAVAAVVGLYNGISFERMIDEVADNLKSSTGAILILLMVGALAGTWLLSGVIPSMIYYGLSLPAVNFSCVHGCDLRHYFNCDGQQLDKSSATVGIAMIGIANALGISGGMAAGAVFLELILVTSSHP